MLVAGRNKLTYVRGMSPLKKILLPLATAALVAILLLPAGAGAQRPGRDCERNKNDNICQQIKKRQEIRDRQRGVTPACRAAYNAYSSAHQRRLLLQRGVTQFRAALKKSKTKKAKAKNAAGLKKYKKLAKKAKKTDARKLAARNRGCVGSKDPAVF